MEKLGRGLWILCHWLGVAAAATFLMRAGWNAFRAPWVWNHDQITVALYAVLTAFVAASWAFLWRREGRVGVKARWMGLRNRPQVTPRFYLGSLLSWIGIAVLMVVAFNMARF